MNDELMESNKETEMDLREELDLAQAHAQEAQRKRDAMQESIADYDVTIGKFRQLVTQLQERIRDLEENQKEASTQAQNKTEVTSAAIMEMPDFRSRLESTKAHAKVQKALILNVAMNTFVTTLTEVIFFIKGD